MSWAKSVARIGLGYAALVEGGAGSSTNVFIVTVQPWTLTARLYPGARWRGSTAPAGESHAVNMSPVGLDEKLTATAAVVALAAVAFWPKGRK